MSLSAGLTLTDLNDYIAPSQACVKPPEPKKGGDKEEKVKGQIKIEIDDETGGYFEVEGAGKARKELEAAQITLNDCLACSGCITSAESVLVALQSHKELYDVIRTNQTAVATNDPALFRHIAVTVSPQSRASIAAKYSIPTSTVQARLSWLFHLLGASLVLDSSFAREISLRATVSEALDRWRRRVREADTTAGPLPVLASACPGWICYAEKTHPHLLPHVSPAKSPQQVAGSMVKTYLASALPPIASTTAAPTPSQIYHLTVMPCYDKKLEATRPDFAPSGVREVDCVLTTSEVEKLWREVASGSQDALHVADKVGWDDLTRMSRGPGMFGRAVPNQVEAPYGVSWKTAGGTSGGYLVHVVQGFLTQVCGVRCTWNSVDELGQGGGGRAREWTVPVGVMDGWVVTKVVGRTGTARGDTDMDAMEVDGHPDIAPPTHLVVRLATVPSRNHDHLDWVITARPVIPATSTPTTLFKFASSHGFRNIQNLVRKLPAPGLGGAQSARMRAKARVVARKKEVAGVAVQEEVGYTFVEVMACPSGCINGGGQLRPDPDADGTPAPVDAREWISKCEAAYRSECDGLREVELWENERVDGVVRDWLGSMDTPKAREALHTEYHAVERGGENALTVKW